MTVTLDNALDLSINRLAEAMTHCFEGYIVPAQFTGPLEASMIRLDGVDLASSIIARNGADIVGTALIARRGKRSRIAAMAVAKAARRQGVGVLMLEKAIAAAKERGEEQIILEVIEQNPAAIALYEKVGFEIQHRLIGFEGYLRKKEEELQPALIGAPAAKTVRRSRVAAAILKDCSFSDVAAALRARGFLASSWSMAPATIEQLSNPTRAVKCGEVFAVLGVPSDEVIACRCLAFAKAPSREAVRIWIDAMANAYNGKKLYIPAFFPEPEYKAAFEGSGLEVGGISQFQMALDLSTER